MAGLQKLICDRIYKFFFAIVNSLTNLEKLVRC